MIILLLITLLTGCAVTPASASPGSALPSDPATVVATNLSQEQRDGLVFMREEEKLAHDLYIALGATWKLPVFTNIAASEQTHTDAVKTLLERYGIADPAASTAPGVFSDPALQALYNDLLAEGKTSVTAALSIGAAVEEIDILDLRERTTSDLPADIARVYSQLEAASENHLRAFVSQYENQTGTAYEPQYLSMAEYTAIMEAAGQGHQGQGNQGQGNQRRGQRP
ncbi:hypothetical protein A9Q02_08095 [Candidatus Chloroploca asiatica]|uniref:DUF2202 domain-containing protein n=2 Tax=Candidatus Chloroploca asiatica TaxID=1506545 RepID=A0A2H3L7L0_9CHLR|nr:hypothetical protein A9Q02_08095 [Candidatus Chloroploca asiatica]